MTKRCLLVAPIMALSACAQDARVREDVSDLEPPVDARQTTSKRDAAVAPSVAWDAADAMEEETAGEPIAPVSDGGAAEGRPVVRDGAASMTTPGLGQPPACASGAALVCEDFEKAAVGALPEGWTREGSVQTLAEEPARGARALRATTPKNAAYSVNRATRKLTIPGTHWGRVYYKVALPAPRPPSGVIHATFLSLTGTMPSGGAAEYRLLDTVVASNDKFQFLYNVQPAGSREFSHKTGYNWSYDGRWHCAEWFIDAANQAFRLYMDGGDKPVLAFSNGAGNYGGTQIPKTFSGIRLGVSHYQNSRTGFVVSLDELTIDEKRPGCSP